MKTRKQYLAMSKKALATELEKAGHAADMADSMTKAEIADLLLGAEPQPADSAPAEPTNENAEEKPAEEPTTKKARKSTRKSVADMIEEVVDAMMKAGADPNQYTIEVNSKNTAVHLKVGKRRVLGYSGPILVVSSEKYLNGIQSEKKNYGYRVAVADMEAVCRNFLLAQKPVDPAPEADAQPAEAEAEAE